MNELSAIPQSIIEKWIARSPITDNVMQSQNISLIVIIHFSFFLLSSTDGFPSKVEDSINILRNLIYEYEEESL